MIIISIFQIIWSVFKFPENLWRITSLPKKKTIRIFLLFSLITAIPYGVASVNSTQQIGRDMQIIADQLPELKIENGKLSVPQMPDKALFIKTDSANFLIQAEKTNESYMIEREIERTPLSFLMGETSLRIATPETQFDLPYSVLEGMSTSTLKAMMSDFGSFNLVTFIPVIIVSYLIGIIDATMQIVIMALMANIFALLFKMRLPFKQNFKLVMVAALIPTTAMVVLNLLGIYPTAQTAIISMLSLYIYYKGIIQHIKKR